MRKKNPKSAIFHSNAPNRLKGYEWFRDTKLAELYNYAPILHDAWVFLEAVRSQMENIYDKEEDFPESLRAVYKVDLPIIIACLKTWQVHNLEACECGAASIVGKKPCSKCMEGLRGERLYEYIRGINQGYNVVPAVDSTDLD